MDTPFFQLPNHNSTIFCRFLRAPANTPSNTEKSNFPSSGSIQSQATATSTVLSASRVSFGHAATRYAASVAAVLFNSPPRMSQGLPSTMS